MAKKKKDIGFVEGGIELSKGAVVLGVGADVAVKAGGNPAGLTTMSSFMPAMGSAMGAGLVVGQLKKLSKSSKRKKV